MSGCCCGGGGSMGRLLGHHLLKELRRRLGAGIHQALEDINWKEKRSWKSLTRALGPALKGELQSWNYTLIAHPDIMWRDEDARKAIGVELEGLRLQDVLTADLVADLVSQTRRIVRQSLEPCAMDALTQTQLVDYVVDTLLRVMQELECRWDQWSRSCRWYNPATGQWGKPCYVDCVYYPPPPPTPGD